MTSSSPITVWSSSFSGCSGIGPVPSVFSYIYLRLLPLPHTFPRAEISPDQHLVKPLVSIMDLTGTHIITHSLSSRVQGTSLGWDHSDKCGNPRSLPLQSLLLWERTDEDTEKRGHMKELSSPRPLSGAVHLPCTCHSWNWSCCPWETEW